MTNRDRVWIMSMLMACYFRLWAVINPDIEWSMILPSLFFWLAIGFFVWSQRGDWK